MAVPIAGASPLMTLTTPAGMPDSEKALARLKELSGVYSEPFKTTVQPAAKAAATAREGL